MQLHIFKTNPIADYGWDWQDKLTAGGNGFGPVKQNRALLEPGDIVLPYDLERELVFMAYAALGSWEWDYFIANDGERREGWFAPGIPLGIGPVELTPRELRAIKSTGRVCFAPIRRALGEAIYQRVMSAQLNVILEADDALRRVKEMLEA
jgi:hypothetical protein